MKYIIVFVITLLAVSSCKESEYGVIDNSIYISEAKISNIKKVMIDDKGGNSTVTLNTASFYEQDVNAQVGLASEGELAKFNERNGTSYKMLPEANFELSDSKVSINAGNISAKPIVVDIKPLTKEQIDSGDKFVLPISIQSANVEMLNKAKTIFYVIDQVIITSVPMIEHGNKIKVSYEGDNIETVPWTVEYRINARTVHTSNNAQSLGYIGAGPATEIYFRYGDANVPGNRIMIKTQGSQFISNVDLKPKTWYHMAWVHDGKTVKLYINGKYDTQMDSPGAVSIINKEFTFADGTDDQYMVSEYRIWSAARTQKQIQESMFSVNPKTEGLEIYLKLNEGEGRVFKDYAGKRTVTATTASDISWKDGVRSDEQ
ncbi:MAG: DUF1735 and LamG domain-containing protein [Carboxylicivirga sp.]|jgi:hypothetical protein|nr:DUF1735 and LamG domain-containing protein [Carboxylicivirga sp.]